MPTTTRFGVVTPAGTDPNDYADALGDLAEAITSQMAGYSEGLLADRPAANVSLGKFYRVTDNNQNGGLFCSNGASWIRITPSPWIAWSPTLTVVASTGAASACGLTVTGATYIYRLLPGASAEVLLELNGSLYGPGQQFVGLLFSSPVASARAYELTGEAMNDIARVRVSDSNFGNVIGIFPNGAYNIRERFYGSTPSPPVGEWIVDNSPRLIRVNGSYPV